MADVTDSPERRFVKVEPQAVTEIWTLIRPHLESLLLVCDGEYSARNVFDLILAGKFHLWLAYSKDSIDGIAISYFVDYPLKRKLMIVGAAGEGAKAWLGDAMSEMKKYASDNGCSNAQIRGRKGWHKLLPDWAFRQVVLEVDL